MTTGLSVQDRVGTLPTDQFGQPVGNYRGSLTSGLKTRPLATGTIQITGGSAGTITATVGGTAISAAVSWAVSHNNTATLLATAINAFAATAIAADPTATVYLATVATDTVTVRQRRSGAIGALSATVTGDVTKTAVDFSADTDTWTTLDSGDTLAATLYYEIAFDATLVPDNTHAATATVVDIDFSCSTQAFRMWQGGFQCRANVITGGFPYVAAAVPQKKTVLNMAHYPILKMAVAGGVDYVVNYI